MPYRGGPSAGLDLVEFVRHPSPRLAPRPGGRLGTFGRLWLACLATVLLTAPASFLGSALSGAANRIDDVPQRSLAVLALVAAPLIEETAFRLPLAPFRPVRLVVAAAATALLLPVWLLPVPAAVVFAVLAPPSRRAIARRWAASFPAIFWASAVLFGLLHAANWELAAGWAAFLAVPLLVLPQAGLGLVLGAARVSLGFAGSVLLHAAYNGTILALVAVVG